MQISTTSSNKIYELISGSNPFLMTEVTEFDFTKPPEDPGIIAENLVATMTAKNGLGLAANQCGLPYRVFAMRGEPNYVCFNPKIVSLSSESIVLEEGCLSYPGLVVKVKRAKMIRCRFTGPDGEVYTKTFTGMTARIFQHELDHLNGVVFYEKANRFHREQAMRKWKRKAA